MKPTDRSRPQQSKDRRPPQEEPHETVYGIAACLAVFRKRREDILRISHSENVRKLLAELLRDAARRRIPYNEVPNEELSRIADTEHHEGLCLRTRARSTPSLKTLVQKTHTQQGILLVLDRIGNPHNLGAILRSASYFGCTGILAPDVPGQAVLTPSAVRIAEGGAENVPVVTVPELHETLRFLQRERIDVLAADTRDGNNAFTFRWPAPCALVLGNEREGLSPSLRALCQQRVSIPGTGDTESLNVSVAAGILLAEWARTRSVTKVPLQR